VVLKGNGDIRVFSIEATVVAPSIVTTLEFSAPAKQSTMQEIPMVNSSGQDWQIRGVVQAAEPGKKTAFVGPPALNVPKGKTIMYPLTFKPMWTCEDNAPLTLTNGGNGDKMEYSLLGTGMEPLAEDHVVISCQARERIQKAFAIDNKGFSGDEVGKGGVVQFSVESDLPLVSGDSQIEIQVNQKMDYTLNTHPLLGGTHGTRGAPPSLPPTVVTHYICMITVLHYICSAGTVRVLAQWST
jgi:hypothetical protein